MTKYFKEARDELRTDPRMDSYQRQYFRYAKEMISLAVCKANCHRVVLGFLEPSVFMLLTIALSAQPIKVHRKTADQTITTRRELPGRMVAPEHRGIVLVVVGLKVG